MTGIGADGDGDRQGSETVVLVVGVFDLFHRGHVELLRRAREFGSRLLVVINGDAFTASYKRRPIFSEEDRRAIVESVRYVDFAVVSNSPDVKPFIDEYRVSIIVHGDDWDHQSYLEQICLDEAYLQEREVELVYTPYYAGESTSGIISRIRSS